MTLSPRAPISPKLFGAVLTASLALWAAYLLADGSGRTGVSASASGCSCHGSTANAAGAVTVAITGPQGVLAGSTNTYTISVTGGPSGTTGGFDLNTNGGTLVAGTGSRVSGNDLTHSNNSRRSWNFTWTAPATAGTFRFAAVGMASNGSGSGGDSWNWFGGAAASPFAITVGSAADAIRPAPVTDLR
jgi:hypothetical protein